MDFNPYKIKSCYTISNTNKIIEANIIVEGNCLPSVNGFEYLGLQLEITSLWWILSKKNGLSLKELLLSFGLGVKPSVSNPSLIVFLFKQYCQSILRHVLDSIHIPSGMLKEFDSRQSMIIKRMIGLKKYAHTKPLNETLRLESVSQIYFKQKIFFLEQLTRDPSCFELFS